MNNLLIDPGVSDKRLLVIESELSRTLKATKRDTNTLSPVLREAWDVGNLNILTRNNPVTATNAHISIVAHTTADELRRLLTDIESGNGFANRFLWFFSKRSKVLPFGGTLEGGALDPIAARLGNAARFSTLLRRIEFDEAAAEEWKRVYPELSDGGKGLVGAITSRSEAHAVRIALIYALLDLSDTINIHHLRAALAIVDYSNRSVVHIFGRKLGDDTADEILRVLTIAGDDGYTRNDLYNHFGKNKPKADISRSLDLLLKNGLARTEREPTGGRQAERWYVLRQKGSKDRKPRGI